MRDKFWPIITAMNAHGVNYTIVGNFGSVIHGVPIGTKDIDFLAEQTSQNYDNLAAALQDLRAEYRGAEGVEIPWHRDLILHHDFVNLTCEYGDFDVAKSLKDIDGNSVGYTDLIKRSTGIEIREMVIWVASLEDIIDSKVAANREKDKLTIPELREFLRQREQDSKLPKEPPTID